MPCSRDQHLVEVLDPEVQVARLEQGEHLRHLVRRRPTHRQPANPPVRQAPPHPPPRTDRAAGENAARSSPTATPLASQLSFPARYRATASTIRATRTSGSTATSPAHTAGQVVCYETRTCHLLPTLFIHRTCSGDWRRVASFGQAIRLWEEWAARRPSTLNRNNENTRGGYRQCCGIPWLWHWSARARWPAWQHLRRRRRRRSTGSRSTC